LLKQLSQVLRIAAAKNIFQFDLHTGNFMVRFQNAQNPKSALRAVYFIDFGKVADASDWGKDSSLMRKMNENWLRYIGKRLEIKS
jgi:predicted unusual protein kinase regulating ubiquinone biosynthesis (AarF/ABC1/UbiB family)